MTSSVGLSAQELAQIRADIAQLLPDTCNILAMTWTSDGAGGQVETWGTATTGAACRVDYRTGSEKVTNAAIIPYQSAIISLAYDVTITPSSRVQVGANTFTVQAVNNAQSWQGVTRVTAELLP